MQLSSLRNRKQALKLVQELDAFPKVPESYQETTATGGGVSVVVFIIIIVLIISEVRYYTSSRLTYDYDVDPHFEGKLQLNIDMTVAMKCGRFRSDDILLTILQKPYSKLVTDGIDINIIDVGADILDLTGQNTETFGHLAEEDAYFELSQAQKDYFSVAQHVNSYLRQEYHTLYDTLWKSGYQHSSSMPSREILPSQQPDACRLHGSLTVNKVAGNFHITAGKSVPVFPRGHAHLSMMMHESDYNFSHRIIKFSFGHSTGGIINPLDGEEKLTSEHNHMFQYFLQVVPTKVDTSFSTIETYQYAATENNRSISHDKGSHGLPGIFFKYDLSSLRVHIRESHQPFWQFLARLCGIVGGIFATSGILNTLVGAIVNILCCRFKVGKAQNQRDDDVPLDSSVTTNLLTSSL